MKISKLQLLHHCRSKDVADLAIMLQPLSEQDACLQFCLTHECLHCRYKHCQQGTVQPALLALTDTTQHYKLMRINIESLLALSGRLRQYLDSMCV
jgi:hypothetical protein